MKRRHARVFVSFMLSLTMLGIFFVTPARAPPGMAAIYFDKRIYYPETRVFWDPNFSVPIEIWVVDGDVNENSVEVNVSSSIDSRKVTLTKVVLGVFSGTVFAVGLGLVDEPIFNTGRLNARYGDEIIAEYFDTSYGSNLAANALFVFPRSILESRYNNLNRWESSNRIVFDSDGIPMVNYGSSIGLQYNPVTVSQYGLANYQAYLGTGNITHREKFLAQAKWLLENSKQKGNYSVWEYNFDWGGYACTDPWVSAMAQGQGLSVLARAYVLTRNISYIDVAEEATLAFQVEMSAGGVRYTDSDGVWFEEYADVGAPSSKVLNGFMHALLGLYEYVFENSNSSGWAFFWEGTETLSNNIHRYDSGSWSYYDLRFNYHAPSRYHELHIEQLRTLYELTGDEIFQYYSNRFQSYKSQSYKPTPVITSTERDPTNSAFEIRIDFNATVDTSVFSLMDYSNCNWSSPQSVSGDDSVWTLQIAPITDGEITVYVPASVYQDTAGNWNTISNLFSITCARAYHELIVTSSPITGITFTINRTLQTTSYTGWLLEDSYTLEMPETCDGCFWSHWFEDGDTNRVKTVTMNTNITLTGVFTPLPIIVSHFGDLVNETYNTWTLEVNVAVHNDGSEPMNYTVNVYYFNATFTQQIGISQNITNLPPMNSKTLTFSWDCSDLPVGVTYLVKANVTGTGGASDEFVNGQMTARLWGDVNGDDLIDLGDVGECVLIYSLIIPEPYYPPHMPDLDGNGVVDLGDVGKILLIYSDLLWL